MILGLGDYIMMKDLFANLAIITSLLYLYTQFTKDYPLSTHSSLKVKLIAGILGGILSNILMQYGIHFEDLIVDLRQIPILLLSFYGGPLPPIIAMIMVIIGRFMIGVNVSAAASNIYIFIVAICSIYIFKARIPALAKIVVMISFSNIIFSIFLYYLTKDMQILLALLPIFWIISYLAGYIGFYMIRYSRRSQLLFKKYKIESTIDSLTGLNNVRKFDEVFNKLSNEVKINRKKLALMYIDIDFFKHINDTYGHLEGDKVLKDLGFILRKYTREDDIVSRNGGEEFTILLQDCDLRLAKEIAENIRNRVEHYDFILNNGQTIKLTVSIGLSSFNETTSDLTLLIDDADKALYTAKRSGRNKVCVCNSA